MLTHVLLVAESATTDAMTRRPLRQQGCSVHSQESARAVEWAKRHLPDLIVWAAPDAEVPADFRLHPETWNIPIVQLVGPAYRPAGLRLEADVRLEHLGEAEFVAAIRRSVSARDARLEEGVLAELRLSLPSDLAELPRLGSLMADWFSLCGLKAFQNRQTTHALHELTANAIEWGHRNERERRVEICAWLEADRVGVLVRDSGPGFDHADLPHAARPGDSFSHLDIRAAVNLREGGFGILTARDFVDYLCFNAKGNEGMLVKFLPELSVVGPQPSAGVAGGSGPPSTLRDRRMEPIHSTGN